MSGLLSSVRVLELGGASSDGVGRLFADLGADVLKVELPGGGDARHALPGVAGASIAFAVHNANKRSAVLDPDSAQDRQRLVELAGAADIVVDSGNPGTAAAFGTSCVALADQFGHLVALSVTDFGSAGPYRSRQATDAVLYAMSTALSRTGPTTGKPVLPPDGVASGTAAVQAAWAALAAFYRRLRDGRGDYIDFSRFEAVLQSLDPPFGSEGQAAVGLKAAGELWRGRPRNQQIYPIFACKDGNVRICLLSARQWRGMRGWLGEPAQFADPKFDTIAARYAASRELNAAIADLFASQTMDDLVAGGQTRGVPVAAVLSAAETLASEHFREVGALIDLPITHDVTLTVPVGPVVVDGQRAGVARPAPEAGADEPDWPAAPFAGEPREADVQRPFDGLRILDLGVIVAGGELGRLFADLGAEVIKVESAAYPDGLRQTAPGMTMSRSWALTHRNEKSLGLDLRHPEGAELFRRLVADADAIFANFKPGTLDSLGFSYERLRQINPRIVLAESSAYGASGPWSDRMGYGPLVRAATGVTWLWTSQDAISEGSFSSSQFFDATTVFPDHVAARLTAFAALAAMIRRERTETGAHVHIPQAEAAVNQLATAYVTEAALTAGVPVTGDESIHGVYPCAGDDEWCVISVRSDTERTALAQVMGRDDLPLERDQFITAVSEWTRSNDKAQVAEILQRAGIPAGPMNRAVDIPVDPQVAFRRLYSDMAHPLFDAPMLSETGPAPYTRIPAAELRPAPMPGDQTRQICGEVLGLSADDTDRLIADGVLFTQQGSR
ncbi:CaiB/BaiF CoA-transferase family protein [Mycobacterium neglectum]|uniref:CaiB/BaiF CoA-transferase family protein n=1 Tax=Mycobacterium neglectum TaxID=242737 RepID=UPI000BFEF98D|nr:CoA transferase [Mycobacterium neglectum]